MVAFAVGCSSSLDTSSGGGSPRNGGSTCVGNSDCSSGLCLGGICQSGQPGGTSCTSAVACTSGTAAAHYLPAYAGNLDIMTSAALRTAERVAAVSA